MFPKYDGISFDLLAIKQKIEKCQADLNRINEYSLDATENRMRTSISDKLNRANEYITTLVDQESTADKDAIWDSLYVLLYDTDVDGLNFIKRDSTPEEIAAFNKQYAREQTVNLVSIHDEFISLGLEIHSMPFKARVENYKSQLEKYNKQRADYIAELKTFNEKIPFEFYGDLMDAHEEAVDRYKTFSDAFKKYQKNYLEILKKDYDAGFNFRMGEHANLLHRADVLEREIKGIENKAREAAEQIEKQDEIRNQLKEINDRQHLRDFQKNEDDRNVQRGIQNEGAQNEYVYSDEVVRFRMQYYENIEKIQNIEDRRSDVPEVQAVYDQDKKMIQLLRDRKALSKLQGDFQKRLDAINYNNLTVEVRNQLTERGKFFVDRLTPEMIEDMRKGGNAVETITAIDYYVNSQAAFADYLDEYAKFMKMNQREIADLKNNVKTLGGLRSAMENKYQAMDKDLNLFLKGQMQNSPEIAQVVLYAWNDVEMADQNLKILGVVIDENVSKKYDAGKEIKNLHDRDRNIVHSIENENNLFELQEGTNDIVNKYNGELQEKRKELALVEKEIEKSDQKLKEEKEVYSKNQRVYRQTKEGIAEWKEKSEKLGAMRNKFNHFYQTHVDTVNRTLDLLGDLRTDERVIFENKDTRIRFDDPFSNVRYYTSEEARRLANKNAYAKKPNHTNSTEYTEMVDALNALSMNTRRNGLSVDEFKTRLQNVQAKAEAYLLAKDNEVRPWPTPQRKFRLKYAREIADFATKNLETLDYMVKSEKDVQAALNKADPMSMPRTKEQSEIIKKIINPTVEVLQKEKKKPEVVKEQKGPGLVK